MNRLWLHHFGQGLVATPNDFGWQSEPPKLDWLALRLIENGWKLKPMHKLILASATWRQTSQFSPDKAEKDLETVCSGGSCQGVWTERSSGILCSRYRACWTIRCREGKPRRKESQAEYLLHDQAEQADPGHAVVRCPRTVGQSR